MGAGAGSRIPGFINTDSKGAYDGCKADALTVGANLAHSRDRRAVLEGAALRDNVQRSATVLRWVHSAANLSDVLTKPTADAMLRECCRNSGVWAIAEGPMMSSKKRQLTGVGRLEPAPVELEADGVKQRTGAEAEGV